MSMTKLSGTDIEVETKDNSNNPIKKFFSMVCPGVRVKAKLENGTEITGMITAFSSIKGKTGHSSMIIDDGKYILNWRLGAFKPETYKLNKIVYVDGRRVNPIPPIISLGRIDGGAVQEYEEEMEAVVLYQNSSSSNIVSIGIDR